MTPTPQGRALLVHVDDMARSWAAALTGLAEIEGAGQPPVRLSTEWVAQTPPLVSRLESRWGRGIVHTRGTAYVQVPRLRGGELDVVQGFSVPTSPLDLEDLHVAPIVREPVWVYLPEGHPLVDRDGVDLRELADAEWLANRADEPAYAYFVEQCGRSGFRPRIAKVAGSLNAFIAALATRRYVTMGTPVQPSRFGPVRALPLTGPTDPAGRPPGRECFVAWRPVFAPGVAERMVEAFRHWYVRLATTRQPRYGEHLRAHPEQYPDVQPALASAAEEAMD